MQATLSHASSSWVEGVEVIGGFGVEVGIGTSVEVGVSVGGSGEGDALGVVV